HTSSGRSRRSHCRRPRSCGSCSPRGARPTSRSPASPSKGASWRSTRRSSRSASGGRRRPPARAAVGWGRRSPGGRWGRGGAGGEGWAAGLRLARVALEREPDPERFADAFDGSGRAVADYLAAEVLGHLEADLREFLVRTSVPELLTAALASVLSGRDDAGDV